MPSFLFLLKAKQSDGRPKRLNIYVRFCEDVTLVETSWYAQQQIIVISWILYAKTISSLDVNVIRNCYFYPIRVMNQWAFPKCLCKKTFIYTSSREISYIHIAKNASKSETHYYIAWYIRNDWWISRSRAGDETYSLKYIHTYIYIQGITVY